MMSDQARARHSGPLCDDLNLVPEMSVGETCAGAENKARFRMRRIVHMRHDAFH